MKHNTEKTYSLLVICFCLYLKTSAVNYYFSSSNGNDSYTTSQAHNPLTPWKTIAKLNAIMNTLTPGDSVLFKSGDTFYGSFTVTVSGNAISPIVFSSYGFGPKPILSGLTALTTWTAQGSNIWESDCPNCGSTVNMVLVNDSVKPMGRYPNYDAPNKGYLNFESHIGNTQITDNQLASNPNWTNGELVIRKNDWIIDRAIITQHTNSNISYSATSNYFPIDNWGYFIQNHPATLDQYGEWFYNPSTKKIQLYSINNPSFLQVKLSSIDNIVRAVNNHNLVFDNITFEGANKLSLGFYGINDLKIKNCNILFSGINGLDFWATNNIVFENNTIKYSNNNSIICNGNNNFFKENLIKNNGIYPGIGNSGDATYTGISINGKNNKVIMNQIDSTGYNGVTFGGDSLLIKNNLITNFCINKDDGAGIYTWNDCPSNSPIYYDRILEGNIILNGIGAPNGKTPSNMAARASGIYLDYNTMNVEVVNNTVAHCSANGVFVNMGYNNNIHKNTVFNNTTRQLHFTAGFDNCNPKLHVINNSLKSNILFAKQNKQLVSEMTKNSSDIINSISQFGQFDSNYYCRPINEEGIISIGDNNSSNVIDLGQWQSTYIKDISSNITPLQITSYTLNNIVGPNKFINSRFNSNINGLYSNSPLNCSPSWDINGGLDTGSLKISLINKGDIVMGIGAVDASKKYLLRFSLKGSKNNQSISAGLRYSLQPYSYITSVQNCKITTSRTENEFLFSPFITENNASIQFSFDKTDSLVWLDNIQLYEVNADTVNIDDYIRFEYNATQSPKTIQLSDQYIDVKSNNYSNSIALQPFTSVVLLKVPNTQSIKNNTVNQKSSISIYPNPTSNQLNFQSENKNLSKILIYDLVGRCILAQTYSSQIDVSGLSNGVYIIHILNKDLEYISSQKIIVQR